MKKAFRQNRVKIAEINTQIEDNLSGIRVVKSFANEDMENDKFKVGNLIQGWTKALTMMPVGSKWEIYIPQELGYGERNAGQIPPYSTLIFTLELKSIVKPETAAKE